VTRFRYEVPWWDIDGRDLFQDNFASDGTVTGTVRTDMASAQGQDWPPGDSVFVRVEYDVPLAQDPYTGDGKAVYAYVAVHPQGQPGKDGAALTDDSSRWPVVDSLVQDGVTWYCVRLDTMLYYLGDYNLDLNDNLFTPGDTIYYYFAATDQGGNTGYASTATLGGVTLASAADARATAFEMTCLPANALAGKTDILYVDRYDHSGAQPYFDSAFEQLGLTPDRYDISNWYSGPGTRVTDLFAQILPYYRKIIWNTSDEGVFLSLIDDDYDLLFQFADNHPDKPGVYLSGDNLASEWDNLRSPYHPRAIEFRNKFMDFGLVSPDHAAVGLPVSPHVIATAGSCFEHGGVRDTMIAYGGCPSINTFDVLDAPGGTATIEMTYGGNPAYGAVLGQVTPNVAGDTARVVLAGFSFHNIRDDVPAGVPDRSEHLHDILNWLQNSVDYPVGTAGVTAYRNWLDQNYPNPFNPTTTIRFSLKRPGKVQIRIYNVRGQLVRTLVDGTRTAGEIHTVRWDGKNNARQTVSSGVYFYRITTGDFVKTKKMVLLR